MGVIITTQQREFFLPRAVNAAIRAGAAILDVYPDKNNYQVDYKADQSPITLADRRAHDVIKSHLSQTRMPILSEEGREMLYFERKGWDLFWMVDPLDGTREFIKGNNEFTVNIALMENNICISSVIYVPYHNKMYIAERGYGAWVMEDVTPTEDALYSYAEIHDNMRRLPLSEREHDVFRVAVSRSHQTPETHSHIDTLRTEHPDLEIIEQGSSYKFCLIAEGYVDYYIRTTTTSEWDTAAGELILHEAGGVTYAYPTGEQLCYNKSELDNPWFVARR